jgi:predicted P-loop ATPase/GTPase
MRLLVAGAAAVDAGKTTFSVGLCHESGATGYKPRAGNDYWYDHDDYRGAIDRGRLYGTDAKRLAAVSPGDVEPEDVNPVHRLWLPIPGRGTGILGREERTFAVDRVSPRDSTPDGDGASGSATPDDDVFVVNDGVDIPGSATASLPLADASSVSTLREFNDLMERLHRPAMEVVADRISQSDRAIVESYADVARPLTDLSVDAVAVVEPRRVRVYDGERYLKACDVASGSARDGRLEERVENVLDLVEPAATVELPALPGEERSDPAAVADAYGPAYDAVLATAL